MLLKNLAIFKFTGNWQCAQIRSISELNINIILKDFNYRLSIFRSKEQSSELLYNSYLFR